MIDGQQKVQIWETQRMHPCASLVPSQVPILSSIAHSCPLYVTYFVHRPRTIYQGSDLSCGPNLGESEADAADATPKDAGATGLDTSRPRRTGTDP